MASTPSSLTTPFHSVLSRSSARTFFTGVKSFLISRSASIDQSIDHGIFASSHIRSSYAASPKSERIALRSGTTTFVFGNVAASNATASSIRLLASSLENFSSRRIAMMSGENETKSAGGASAISTQAPKPGGVHTACSPPSIRASISTVALESIAIFIAAYYTKKALAERA